MAKAKGGFKPEDLKRLYFWIVLPLILVLAIAFTFVVKSKIKMYAFMIDHHISLEVSVTMGQWDKFFIYIMIRF